MILRMILGTSFGNDFGMMSSDDLEGMVFRMISG